MSDRNSEAKENSGGAFTRRAEWERPALRRLMTSEARGGGMPGNDGVGGGGGSPGQHS